MININQYIKWNNLFKTFNIKGAVDNCKLNDKQRELKVLTDFRNERHNKLMTNACTLLSESRYAFIFNTDIYEYYILLDNNACMINCNKTFI